MTIVLSNIPAPTNFTPLLPCPSWCDTHGFRVWRTRTGGIDERDIHNGSVQHVEHAAEFNSAENEGVGAYLSYVDFGYTLDARRAFIGVQLGNKPPFMADAGFLTSAGARQLAAALLNLADTAEGVEH